MPRHRSTPPSRTARRNRNYLARWAEHGFVGCHQAQGDALVWESTGPSATNRSTESSASPAADAADTPVAWAATGEAVTCLDGVRPLPDMQPIAVLNSAAAIESLIRAKCGSASVLNPYQCVIEAHRLHTIEQ